MDFNRNSGRLESVYRTVGARSTLTWVVMLQVIADRLRGRDRALVWARVDGGVLRVLEALGEARRLVAADRAQGRIGAVAHLEIAIGVPHEPDLGHTVEAEQKGRLEGLHGPGELFRAGRHGYHSTTCSASRASSPSSLYSPPAARPPSPPWLRPRL